MAVVNQASCRGIPNDYQAQQTSRDLDLIVLDPVHASAGKSFACGHSGSQIPPESSLRLMGPVSKGILPHPYDAQIAMKDSLRRERQM